MPPRRFRAPAGDGEVLADPPFARVPELVERNRRILDTADVVIGGLPLRDLRALARREVLELTQGPGIAIPGLSPDAPLLLAGHQPEFSHPGVWVKHFALNGLARKLGGVPLNLVVDNDTLKSTSLRFSVRDRDPAGVHLQSVPFDRFEGEEPYEDRRVHDPECFRTFAHRAAAVSRSWGFDPLLPRVWADVLDHPAPTVGGKFAAVRRKWERDWGCRNLELPVSELAGTTAFGRFAGHIVADLPRFRTVYNQAVREYRRLHAIQSRSHPVPDLGQDDGWDEAPFWVWRDRDPARRKLLSRSYTSSAESRIDFRVAGDRQWEFTLHHPSNAVGWGESWNRLTNLAANRIHVRPRALTLTLFARVCLGDFFVHGIGGGKYDEVTDAIIRDYFGLEPPAYQVLSATLRLPLPKFPADADEVKRLERLARDLHWNPQRHLPDPAPEHAALAAVEPPDGPGRKERYREFRRIGDGLRPRVADRVADVRQQLERARQEERANAVLGRRDYSWVLYPEDVLRPFLQKFLEV